MRFIAIFLLLVAVTAHAKPKDKQAPAKKGLTRATLLKKSKIPERRKYPLSPRSTPCQDFHHYVCSEAEYKFKLPSNQEDWVFAYDDLRERLNHAKIQFLNRMPGYKAPSEREAQFKDFYLSCLNTGTSASESRHFMIEDKKQLAKIKTNEELATYAVSKMEQGINVFSYFDVVNSRSHSLKRDFNIRSDIYYLAERSYYENKELITEFKLALVNFFKTLQMDKPEERAQWVIDFETEMVKALPAPGDPWDKKTLDREMTRAEFLSKYPHLKMDSLLAKIPADTLVRESMPIGNKFLDNAFATYPLEQLKSVYLVRFSNLFLKDGYSSVYRKFFTFRSNFMGTPKVPGDRHVYCADKVETYFPMELDRQLVDVLFPDFQPERIEKLSEAVRATLIATLEKNTWLSSSARKEAIKKVKNAKLLLGKPRAEEDWFFWPIKKYSSTKFISNVLLARQAQVEWAFQALAGPRNPNQWSMSPLTVNARYFPSNNSFVLPIALLQPPFYDPEGSDIENMAGIGFTVSHELSHAFDDTGAKYDETGKFYDWFSRSDNREFNERRQKFVSLFNKIGHNGELTRNENVADNAGLMNAYTAANPSSTEDKKNFFINYARKWCVVATPAYQQRYLKTSSHAWPVERVNQQVVHLDGFYEAFSCTENDKMYIPSPARIKIW